MHAVGGRVLDRERAVLVATGAHSRYCPDADLWEELPAMPTARCAELHEGFCLSCFSPN